MLVFSWNVHGLGNQRIFRDLKNFLHGKRPDLIFFAETRMIAVQMGVLVTRLGSYGLVCVPHDGLSGDLYAL